MLTHSRSDVGPDQSGGGVGIAPRRDRSGHLPTESQRTSL